MPPTLRWPLSWICTLQSGGCRGALVGTANPKQQVCLHMQQAASAEQLPLQNPSRAPRRIPKRPSPQLPPALTPSPSPLCHPPCPAWPPAR